MSETLRPLAIALADDSQISEARRETASLALTLGFDEQAIGNLSIAVTEAATNVLRHGCGGHIILRPLPATGPEAAGIEVMAVDKGPGMHNVADSMRDGHSTIGTAGNGLGAISRLTRGLEIYSARDKGTALRFESWRGTPPADSGADFGVVDLALRGETVSGDGWMYERNASRSLLAVVDGLGHGADAAVASRAALETFARRRNDSPAGMMGMAHDALRPTRGAAASVAAWDPESGQGQFCGVGNVSTVVIGDTGQRSLVSHNGTLGHSARTLQPFEFQFPRNGLLIMHSDGLGTRWSLDHYPGLRGRHPALIAAVLWRDYQRGRDDVTVAVVRNGGPG